MLREGKDELRKVYVDTLISLAEKDKNIVMLEADLAGAIGSKKFYEKYPEQYINCGIMEANMVSVSAGLSLRGKKPFLHTFGSFASRRAFDQIFICLAYSNLGATIIGSDCGVTSEHNGGTHMPFEDIGIMRNLYNCNIVEASDEAMLKKLLIESYEKGGLWYIRMSRKKLPRLYGDDEVFELGTAKVLKDGTDAVLLSYGISVSDCVMASEVLVKEGINVSVIDMFSINPLDKKIIKEYLQKTKVFITVENHSITNGLGSAVAEVIAESGFGTKFSRLGVRDKYGQTGKADYLKKVYGIDVDSIVNEVRKMV